MKKMPECIIDTNVVLVAEPSTHMSNECSARCADFIGSVVSGKFLMVIDDDYLLLEEYERYKDKHNPYSYPQRFLKWIYTYQSNPRYIKQVKINKSETSGFKEIPESIKTVGIDPSDLKFIAVSFANSNLAPIYEASDSKWIGWEKSLNEEGVQVIFLCKDELSATYNKKMQ